MKNVQCKQKKSCNILCVDIMQFEIVKIDDLINSIV